MHSNCKQVMSLDRRAFMKEGSAVLPHRVNSANATHRHGVRANNTISFHWAFTREVFDPGQNDAVEMV